MSRARQAVRLACGNLFAVVVDDELRSASVPRSPVEDQEFFTVEGVPPGRMATEATFTVPAHEFPLGTLFEQVPDATVELERIIPARDVVVPYFWVRGAVVDDIEGAFSDHAGVASIRLVDSVEDQYLLRVEWALEYTGVLSALSETDVALIEAVGTSQRWTFDVRGDDRADIAAFRERCRELDIPVTLTELHALTPIESDTGVALTDAQQEALVLAYERGYFASPREVTMAELGDELGISQQAVASRIRRGLDQILGNVLSDVELHDR